MSVSYPQSEYEIIAPNEALIGWKHNKVTQQVANIVEQEILVRSRRVGGGETLGEDVVQATARAVGYIEGLQFAADLLEFKFVVDTKEDKDDKKEGKETP